jgi:UDPglucose 6-dehydrogenase
MRLVIVGTGYVGLVAGACFAEMGHHVLCIDIDQEKINALHQGIVPIYEKGLKELIIKNCSAQRLSFTTNYSQAVQFAHIFFIAVNTPVSLSGEADLSQIKKVIETLSYEMEEDKIFVNKSTAPVGTCHFIETIAAQVLEDRGVQLNFHVVSNPEFLREGDAIADFMQPDRIIVGARKREAFEEMHKIYAPFMLNQSRLIEMDLCSAEMVKYAANAMLATRISFMNELSHYSEKVNADIEKVRIGLGSDSRIGSSYLYPGIGIGGSCLPKDLRLLASDAKKKGCKTALLDAVLEVNAEQKKLLYKKIHTYFEGELNTRIIAILGLSFKPDTDDMREAPSLVLIESLLEAGCNLRLFDPEAMVNAKKILGNNCQITWCESKEEAVKNADALCLVTEWQQFRLLNGSLILSLMRGKAFFDGRNQYNPAHMANIGFDYFSIGVSCSAVKQHEPVVSYD